MSIITACPTLTNPEAIHDIATLRAELHRANDSLVEKTRELHEAHCLLGLVANDLKGIVVAYLARDAEAVIQQLDDFYRRHVVVRSSADTTTH